MKLTEKEIYSYRTTVWNLICSIEQGWTDYKQKISELKQIDKRLFDNANITNAMHPDDEDSVVLEKSSIPGDEVNKMSEFIQKQLEYIKKRLRHLDETHRSCWPGWTNSDYVAASQLLTEMQRITNAMHPDGEGRCPKCGADRPSVIREEYYEY